LKIFFAFFLLLIVTSCTPQVLGPPPNEVVATFLGHLQASEYYEADAFVIAESPVSFQDVEEEYRGIFHNLTYGEMTEIINGNYATVTVSITNVYFTTLMDSIINEIFHLIFTDITDVELTEIIETMLIERLNSDTSQYDRLTTEVTVNLMVFENYWRIIIDEPFADAMTGGLLTFVAEAQQS